MAEVPPQEGGVPDDRLDRRIPEPELMDEADQVEAYAAADFADVNQGFVDRFCQSFPERVRGTVVDLGCGPADIPLRLARAVPALEILAIDAARAMLEAGRRVLASRGAARRVRLLAARVPALPLRGGVVDACISNSSLHHLPEPVPFWREVRRIARPGAALFVMDLSRPVSRAGAREIVERYAGQESAILRRDFYNSLLAAFTVAEVRSQLAQSGLERCRCEAIDDRHWLVAGRIAAG